MEKGKKTRKIILISMIISAILSLLVFSFLVIYSKSIDYSADESLFAAAKSSTVTKLYYDAENSAECLESYEPRLYEEIYGITRKEWIPYSEISESLKNAFVSMEDRRFFEHSGVNLKRTLGAFLNYIFRFKGNFGGSTITQQVVKNISGDNERSIKRKFNEIFRAYHMERCHGKEEILELYMNIVELGDGIIGVGEGAEHYFGKEAKELNYIEAATLVGMANAPTKYNPYKNPDLCREKRNKVLFSLAECGHIDKAFYNSLKELPLSVVDKESGESYINSWFAETVIEDASLALADKLDVSQNLARKLLKSGGYKIYTTVSPTIQKELEEYFKNTDNFPKAVKSGLEFSMVISEHENGNLLATVGGVGEKSGNRILNYAETNITPGSTLKPIALYAPLLDAKKISWSSVFDDVPVKFQRNGSTLPLAFPRNSPDVYDGLTPVKDALSLSKNTVAVRLFSMLGAENIYENLYENFGFSSLVKGKRLDNGTVVSDLSESPLALGQLTYGVSLRKLTESYNVFPNDGMLSKGRSFIAIFDSSDNLILENKTEPKQVFSAECARIMNKLLEAVVDEGTAKRISLNEIVDTAGKTGTSGGGHDKLFVGYTPYFTAGIWCGYKGDKRAVHFESKTHLDIWNDIATRVYNSFNIREEERHFSVDGLVYLPYCKDSGEMFSENCMLDPRSDRIDFGYFTSDNAPNSKCQRHVVIRYDKSSGGIATDLCPENEIVDIALLKIEGRSFPYEIFVKDAEYTVRAFSGNEDLAKEYLLPHFDKNLPKLEYSGKSRKKKQFNSSCDIHEE